MTNKIQAFILDYYDHLVSWYHSLTYLEQIGILLGTFVVLGLIVAYFIIRKATS